MTSDISFILKFIHQYDQSALEHSTPNGTLPNRLLSPIIENAVEILPAENISSQLPRRSSSIHLTDNPSTHNVELNQSLLEKLHEYTNHFDQIQTYLTRIDEHFHALTFLIEHLRYDQNLNDSIEFFQIRLVQMRAKRDQIDRLLNQSSLQNLIKQITPYLLRSALMIDYPELLTSIQLSMNQKTVLIDHLKNDYRYRKYRLKEYSTKFDQQQDLLGKLIKQIEEYLAQHERSIGKINSQSLFNQHNRQSMELIELSNEYEQLQNEYDLLTSQSQENLRKFSAL